MTSNCCLCGFYKIKYTEDRNKFFANPINRSFYGQFMVENLKQYICYNFILFYVILFFGLFRS
ncbi:hypothetical protein SPHINGO8BC_60512 [Sphingobacterium multivorum]|uniref:Uncharacterized protein n=1 Tax=Sphingobacterium multivorum TaxID=28454 RepID=A0A654DJ84_SPHMU|nr:hypothetical protein SPHINGO8BC_60512 [Sphingobacterium multivorum]